jgi:endonuclease YncB( thermonuclease family)
MHPDGPRARRRPHFGSIAVGILRPRDGALLMLIAGRGAMWSSARPPKGGLRLALAFLLLALAPALAAPDSKRTPAASAACDLETVASGTVQSVTDGRTFILADGHEVRLPAVEIPALPAVAAPAPAESAATTPAEPPQPPPPDPDQAAAAALRSLLDGRHVALRASKLVTDRYGRILADALATRDGYPGSAQKTLLSQGLAFLTTRPGDPGCRAELRAAERIGRAAKLGLWADPRYLPRAAEDLAGLSAERGRFTLVEGKVVSVRESGGTIYVNFGRRWSEDFTVTISKRNERQFIDAGLRPSGLSGRRVMVRGWIEERGGPWIEAAGPEQIEIIAEK